MIKTALPPRTNSCHSIIRKLHKATCIRIHRLFGMISNRIINLWSGLRSQLHRTGKVLETTNVPFWRNFDRYTRPAASTSVTCFLPSSQPFAPFFLWAFEHDQRSSLIIVHLFLCLVEFKKNIRFTSRQQHSRGPNALWSEILSSRLCIPEPRTLCEVRSSARGYERTQGTTNLERAVITVGILSPSSILRRRNFTSSYNPEL